MYLLLLQKNKTEAKKKNPVESVSESYQYITTLESLLTTFSKVSLCKCLLHDLSHILSSLNNSVIMFKQCYSNTFFDNIVINQASVYT